MDQNAVQKEILIGTVSRFLDGATEVYHDDSLASLVTDERNRFSDFKMNYSEVELLQIIKKVLDQAAKSFGKGSTVRSELCSNLSGFSDYAPGVQFQTFEQYQAFVDMKIKELSGVGVQGKEQDKKDEKNEDKNDEKKEEKKECSEDVLNRSREYLQTYVNAISSGVDDEKLLKRRDDLNKQIEDMKSKLDVFQALKNSLDLANSAAPAEEADKKSFLKGAITDSRITELPPLFGGEEIMERVNFEYLNKFTNEQLAILEPRILGIPKNKFYIGSGVGAGLFLLLILVVILIIYKKRKRSSQSTLDDIPRANVIQGGQSSDDKMASGGAQYYGQGGYPSPSMQQQPQQPGPYPPQYQYGSQPPTNPPYNVKN